MIYSDIGEIPLELDETPPEELSGKIDAIADVLPDANVLGEDRLVTAAVPTEYKASNRLTFSTPSPTRSCNWSGFMGVKRTGDWEKARARLNAGMRPRLANALAKRPSSPPFFWCARSSAAPAPKPRVPGFAKLAESTIAHKGSSKALIDTGFLINAITQKIMADKAFVGL